MGSSIDLKKWKEQNLLHRLIYDWILVPIGIIVILCIVILVNQIFRAINFNFPANVASMLIVSALLIIGEKTLKPSTMSKILLWINPAIEFIMEWMIIFFFPPILAIVNSPHFPTGGDIVKLIIVFFLGLFIFIPFIGYVVHFARVIFDRFKRTIFKSTSSRLNNRKEDNKKMAENNKSMIEVVVRDDDPRSETTNSKTKYDSNMNNDLNSNTSNSETDIDITDATFNNEINQQTIDSTRSDITNINDSGEDSNQKTEKIDSEMEVTEKCKTSSADPAATAEPKKANAKAKKQEKEKFKWKSSILPSKYCIITYLLIYAVSWIPAALWNITQPLHIAATILAYFLSLAVPDRLRIVFHPMLCCTVFSYTIFWIQGLIFGRGLKEEIKLYSNDSKYLSYLNDTSLPFPKASELLFCLLDVTVVAFSFKILEHHQLILNHLFELVGSIIVMSFTSMTVHTGLCRLLGVSPIYALSMTSRSSTNPLAVQVSNYLHSDMAIAIVLVAFTGIFADIIGIHLLRLVRFPFSDSLAHGACMGCAGHAMATAGLVRDFPSASAVSSISFVLFSTCCVIWSAIPPVTHFFQSLAGM